MSELEPILRTIREVEESLDRRSARAAAVVMMTWGAVATAIFAFYALVDIHLLEGMSGTALHWAWAPPIVLGYILTSLTQVRLGRMQREGVASIRRLRLALLVPLALVVLAIVTGFGWQLIPALWVAFLGYACLTWDSATTSTTNRVVAYASFAAAAVLAVPMAWPWANLGAAVWYATFLFGYGVWRYHSA